MYKKIDLQSKERYSFPADISKEKLNAAMELALKFMDKNIDKFGSMLIKNASGYDRSLPEGKSYLRYTESDKVRWTNGMWSALYWLAYLVTGAERYKTMAEGQISHFIEMSKHPEQMDDHDTGFKFLPSCVAAYKITGNEEAREAALRGAEALLDHFCNENKFIIRIGKRRPQDEYIDYRMLVDSMMNIPLFFWAYEQTGNKAYYDAGVEHYRTTAKYLIREDGSSYHHYQFDPITLKPVGGRTFQGNRDESCWSRGHSWLMIGYPIAYKYTKDKEIFDIHNAVSYYFMDNLPIDNVPFWDFDFNVGSFEPRDSSASCIAACGLYEMLKYLPDDAPQRVWFKNAADMMLEAAIDRCANRNLETDALLKHVTGARYHELQCDSCAIYGDYFYFEALVRALRPDIEIFW